MKIVLLSGANIIHTVRWANSLSDRGHDVHLLSLQDGGEGLSQDVKLVFLPFKPVAGYYLNMPFVRHYLWRHKPDLINAHYASGYGTLARLSGFHPLILSVWGSDVYDFPNHSGRNLRLIKKNISYADLVCSTSRAMAKVTKTLCPTVKKIYITPFGVDTSIFRPALKCKSNKTLTIGTVKSLSDKYGIDILIRSFVKVKENTKKNHPQISDSLRLLIIGEGPKKKSLLKLANSLGVGDVTNFQGAIRHEDVPLYLNKIDIYATLSSSESFGVAIIEASSCALPVVVSDVDGPKEVVSNGETGIIVPREDVTESALAIEKLIIDNELRTRLGTMGRKQMIKKYDWDKCVNIMEKIYRKAMSLGFK